MPDAPTIARLKADLRAANQEAKGYLETIGVLRGEVEVLKGRLFLRDYQVEVIVATLRLRGSLRET